MTSSVKASKRKAVSEEEEDSDDEPEPKVAARGDSTTNESKIGVSMSSCEQFCFFLSSNHSHNLPH